MNAIVAGTRTMSILRAAYIAVIALAVGLALGFGGGWQVHGWRVAKQELKTERTQQRVATKQRARQHTIAAENARAETAIHEEHRRQRDAIDDEVAAHPERWGCDIGDSGLQVWNGAGRVPDAGSEPVGTGERRADRDVGSPAGSREESRRDARDARDLPPAPE